MVKSKKEVIYAATQWFRYDPSSIFSPQIGEWCLFTMEIDGKRNYFSGKIIETASGAIRIRWDYGASYEINDTLHWARIRKLNPANQGKLGDVNEETYSEPEKGS